LIAEGKSTEQRRFMNNIRRKMKWQATYVLQEKDYHDWIEAFSTTLGQVLLHPLR
jgi:hypothetical protein